MAIRDWLRFKENPVARLIVQYLTGQPVWTPRDFENLAKEGFEGNVWVYRCVMAVSQAAAGIPIVLYQRRGKELVEVETHKLLDLINRPNPNESKSEFIEKWVAYLLLSGNSYITLNGPNAGPPSELWTLRPDRMQVIPDSMNFVRAYRYTVNQWTDLPAEKVLHQKLFSALDDFYGLSPIAVAGRGIDNDNAAHAWNNSMLNNSARPSGAMVTDANLTDPQYTKLQAQLDMKYTGQKNRGKPMLLEGGLKWQQMSLSPTDMDFINSKKMSRVEICAAFGVPPEIVGDKEHATYSNYKEARESFYEETVLIVLGKLIDKLNAQLVPLFGEGFMYGIDRDQIDALQENANDKFKRANEGVKTGLLTINEGRQSIGYEDIDGGNVRLIPVNVLPVGEDEDMYSTGATATDPNADPAADPNADVAPPGDDDPKL